MALGLPGADAVNASPLVRQLLSLRSMLPTIDFTGITCTSFAPLLSGICYCFATTKNTIAYKWISLLFGFFNLLILSLDGSCSRTRHVLAPARNKKQHDHEVQCALLPNYWHLFINVKSQVLQIQRMLSSHLSKIINSRIPWNKVVTRSLSAFWVLFSPWT